MTADKNRDRWNNSPKGPPPRNTFGGAGGGDFERDRDYSEGVTADDKAEDEGAERTTTADEVTGPDAGDERYGEARDRERQRTGNIGAQKPDGTK